MQDREGATHRSWKEQKKKKVCLITAPRSTLAEHGRFTIRPRKHRNSSDTVRTSDFEEKSENGSGEWGTCTVDRSAFSHVFE